MIAIHPRLVVYACAGVTAAIIIGTLWIKLERAERDAASLAVARETIRFERETVKIASRIDMRVNLETTQTARRAEDADHEIERIRTAGPATTPPDAVCDDACARIVQLAREARDAARASSARLQPTHAGTR